MYPFPGIPDDWYDPGPLDELGGRSVDPDDGRMGTLADELIADRIVSAVLGNPLVRGRYLEIQVQNRVVILLGELASADACALVRKIAWTVPGVWDVGNRLSVLPAGRRDAAATGFGVVGRLLPDEHDRG